MALAPTIGRLTRRLARRCGVELVHPSSDPVHAALLATPETLRVTDVPSWKADHLLAHVAAEVHLRNLLRHYAINCVVDVGANEGQFATGLRQLGYPGRIVSFEPQSGPMAVLQQRAAGDPQWEVHAFGLGEAVAELPLIQS
jgi:hypothetical protein